jgi:hypothetical protein
MSEQFNGITYTIVSHEPLLYGIPADGETTYAYPLDMSIPFHFVYLGGEDSLLVVSGLVDSTDTGILQFLSVADGRVVETIRTLELPGIHPFSLAGAGSRLHVLDTAGSRILEIEDADGDGIPETLSPIPFARAIDFPVLATTLSIEIFESGTLILDPTDRRLAGYQIDLDREFTLLQDVDLDDVADVTGISSWRYHLDLIPGFLDPPRDTSSVLHVLASTGVGIELTLTDSTGSEDFATLGTGGVPLGSNEGIVVIHTPLVAGTYVRLDDVVTGLSSYAALVNAEDVPVLLSYFTAERSAERIVLRWGVAGDAGDHAGFHVHRQVADQERERLTQTVLSGRESYDFVDQAAPSEAARYWLEDRGRDGSTRWHGPVSVPAAGESSPAVPELYQNSPNPFRKSTLLSFRTTTEGMVILRVFDLSGRELARPFTGFLLAGRHETTWDGRDASGNPVAAGTYFYRLDARGGALTRKLVLL